jgi:putative flippase GtrA
LVGFCVVGGLSTLFYLLLYSGFRTFSGSQIANALALLVSAVANTAANRRLTFGVRGPGGAVRHQAQGLVVFAIGLALTSGSLAALNAATDHAAHSTELAVLVAANLAATVLRFLLFRAWVFPERTGTDGGTSYGEGASYVPGTAHGDGAFDAGPYAGRPYSSSARPSSASAPAPAPLPRRPVSPASAPRPVTPGRPARTTPHAPEPTSEAPHDTTGFRATDGADLTYGDAATRTQPVLPHDTDTRDM